MEDICLPRIDIIAAYVVQTGADILRLRRVSAAWYCALLDGVEAEACLWEQAAYERWGCDALPGAASQAMRHHVAQWVAPAQAPSGLPLYKTLHNMEHGRCNVQRGARLAAAADMLAEGWAVASVQACDAYVWLHLRRGGGSSVLCVDLHTLSPSRAFALDTRAPTAFLVLPCGLGLLAERGSVGPDGRVALWCVDSTSGAAPSGGARAAVAAPGGGDGGGAEHDVVGMFPCGTDGVCLVTRAGCLLRVADAESAGARGACVRAFAVVSRCSLADVLEEHLRGDGRVASVGSVAGEGVDRCRVACAARVEGDAGSVLAAVLAPDGASAAASLRVAFAVRLPVQEAGDDGCCLQFDFLAFGRVSVSGASGVSRVYDADGREVVCGRPDPDSAVSPSSSPSRDCRRVLFRNFVVAAGGGGVSCTSMSSRRGWRLGSLSDEGGGAGCNLVGATACGTDVVLYDAAACAVVRLVFAPKCSYTTAPCVLRAPFANGVADGEPERPRLRFAAAEPAEEEEEEDEARSVGVESSGSEEGGCTSSSDEGSSDDDDDATGTSEGEAYTEPADRKAAREAAVLALLPPAGAFVGATPCFVCATLGVTASAAVAAAGGQKRKRGQRGGAKQQRKTLRDAATTAAAACAQSPEATATAAEAAPAAAATVSTAEGGEDAAKGMNKCPSCFSVEVCRSHSMDEVYRCLADAEGRNALHSSEACGALQALRLSEAVLRELCANMSFMTVFDAGQQQQQQQQQQQEDEEEEQEQGSTPPEEAAEESLPQLVHRRVLAGVREVLAQQEAGGGGGVPLIGYGWVGFFYSFGPLLRLLGHRDLRHAFECPEEEEEAVAGVGDGAAPSREDVVQKMCFSALFGRTLTLLAGVDQVAATLRAENPEAGSIEVCVRQHGGADVTAQLACFGMLGMMASAYVTGGGGAEVAAVVEEGVVAVTCRYGGGGGCVQAPLLWLDVPLEHADGAALSRGAASSAAMAGTFVGVSAGSAESLAVATDAFEGVWSGGSRWLTEAMQSPFPSGLPCVRSGAHAAVVYEAPHVRLGRTM